MPASLTVEGLISLFPASSDCISALVWDGMLDGLVLVGVAVAVSHGGEGADGPLEAVELDAGAMVTVPPPSSTAASPALLAPTWIVELLALLDEPVPYQEFRSVELIVPMSRRRTPNPLAGTCARRV